MSYGAHKLNVFRENYIELWTALQKSVYIILWAAVEILKKKKRYAFQKDKGFLFFLNFSRKKKEDLRKLCQRSIFLGQQLKPKWNQTCRLKPVDFPVAQTVKRLPTMRDTWVWSLGRILWRRKWQPTPVLLLGKSHGWRSVVGYSPRGRKE